MANTQIKNNTGSNTKTVNGVKYFKLVSKYPGDYTKNCGLLGNEIDENFYFLRGYDIKSMSLNDNKDLILTRLNGEKLSVNIGEEMSDYEFSYNEDTGVLTVTYPNGETVEIDGFAVKGGTVYVATDETLKGDGTIANPLGLSRTLITGQYSPVDNFIDLTDGSPMPDGDFKGQRLITKEKVDVFGKLYTSRDVAEIEEQLGDSGWRIPTAADWNDLCNSIECPEDKNHSNVEAFHGKIAGKVLKSTEMWGEVLADDGTPLVMGSNDRGFNALPVGYCDDPMGGDLIGLYKKAQFWSKTSNSDDGYYTKTLVYNHEDVKATNAGADNLLSLRLIKDGYDKNGKKLPNYDSIIYDFQETEIILGQLTPIVRMDSDRRSGYTLWTQINMSVGNGVRPEEWDNIPGLEDGFEPGYFVCEWNGEYWEKRQMIEGDSVVIKDFDGESGSTNDQYKEWRLIKGELVNYDDLLISLIDTGLSSITETVNDLSDRVETLEETVQEHTEIISALTVSTAEANGESLVTADYVLGIEGTELLKRNGETIGITLDMNFGNEMPEEVQV